MQCNNQPENPATSNQISLIEMLQDRGAIIPANDHGNPDNSMFETFTAADLYIKQWGHLMATNGTKSSPSEWGAVLNH